MSHEIVRLAEILAARRGRSPRTVCRWATGDGALYGRLAGGSDVAWRRGWRILRWFSDEWPADLHWPTDIPRPGAQPPPACEGEARRAGGSPGG